MYEELFAPAPIVQVAIDVLNEDAALRVAEAAVKAGADWLECGTPLITFCGTPIIGKIARAFPGVPVLADYKCMDGARKYAIETKAQGGQLCTVCAQAADSTVKAMAAAGKEAGVAILVDLINCPDVPGRALQVEAMGVDAVYIHWGADQRNEFPDRDAQTDLPATLERVKIPVGSATWSHEDGVRIAKMGAKICVIGFPLIGEADVEGALRKYVDAVKST